MSFGLGFGILFEGSWIARIIGVLLVLLALYIFRYNWLNPVDNYIPTISEAIKTSKVVWGFWHTGERAKHSFEYDSVKRILILEPNPDSEALNHVLRESGANKNDVIQNVKLTKASAESNKIVLKYHNEVTSLSYMICDPSPTIEGELVKFSKRAFIVAQVLDRNLNIEEWSVYKKGMATDKYAFNAYVKWFKDVWDNRSKVAV